MVFSRGGGGVACLHAKTPQGYIGHLCFVRSIVTFDICVTPLLALHRPLNCEPRPCHTAALPLVSALINGMGYEYI